MRIEEITRSKLSKAANNEVYGLRLRFIQLWDKNFQDNDNKKAGDLQRNDFLKRYKLLIDEMKKRKLNHSVKDIDRALFRKVIWGIELSDFEDISVVKDYVSIVGSFVKSPTKAKSVDLVIREDEENKDEKLESEISNLIKKQIKKDCNYRYERKGPDSSYIPLFDKVLRTNKSLQVIEVKEQKANASKSEESDLSNDSNEISTNTHKSQDNRLETTSVAGNNTYKGDSETKSTETFTCECIECGYTIKSSKHCKDLKCKKCDGQMRRKSRPGYGQKEKSEINVRVINKTKETDGNFTYDCEIQYHTHIGKTQLTSTIADVGDILKMSVDEIEYNEEQNEFTWNNPIVSSKKGGKTPVTTISQAKEVAKLCKMNKDDNLEKDNIDFQEEEKGEKLFEKYVPIFDVSKKKDERIVCGIVYEPDVEDSQGDKADAEEIKKAAYKYMEHAQRFKVNHKGYNVEVAILESYIAPVDFTIGKQKIKKGSWLMTTRILDDEIWKKIKSGELTGYSMAGWARSKESN